MFRVPASPNAYVYECGCANLKCIKLRSCRGVDPYFSDVAVRQAEQEGGGYIFCHLIKHRSLRTECGASFLFWIFLWCCGCCAVGPRYRLQAHVGSGSYGDVCRALDLEFGQIIALKVTICIKCPIACVIIFAIAHVWFVFYFILIFWLLFFHGFVFNMH